MLLRKILTSHITKAAGKRNAIQRTLLTKTIPNVDNLTCFVANFMYKTYPAVDTQFSIIQDKPVDEMVMLFQAAATAPNSMTPKAASTRNSGLFSKKKKSPIVVKTFVMFLKTVTMGTELFWRLAMPVKSIPQRNNVTGAHDWVVFHVKLGYSTQPMSLDPSTQMTATMA